MDELQSLTGPKLVLASFPSLDTGFAATLFRSWSTDPLNTIILPDKGPVGSLCRNLYNAWVQTVENGQAEDQIRNPVCLDMDIQLDVCNVLCTVELVFYDEKMKQVKEKLYLEGEELELHLAAEAERKRVQEEQEAIRRTLAGEEEDELSDIEEEVVPAASTADSRQPNASNPSDKLPIQPLQTYHPFDIYVKDMARSSGFFKHAQVYRMFPVHEPRCRVDDYGETIDPSSYMREEEQTAIEVAAGHGGGGDKTSPDAAAAPVVVEEKKEVEEVNERPHKYVEYSMDLKVVCQVVYIDFEGRSDGKSIKNILSQVAPRKLVS